jgi:hypothetical protein
VSEQPESRVYFVRCGRYVKVGCTRRPIEQRMAELGDCWFIARAVSRRNAQMEALGSMPGLRPLEREVHAYFHELRQPGTEWFEMHPDLMAYIDIAVTDPERATRMVAGAVKDRDERTRRRRVARRAAA